MLALRSTLFSLRPCLQAHRCITTSAPAREIFHIQSVDDFNEKVKKSHEKPVIVDFFATWCAPCRMLTPRIESIISQNEGKVVLAKVDIDEHSDLALDYEVSSVPVLVAIKNGKIHQRMVGLQDQDKLEAWVKEVVDAKK